MRTPDKLVLNVDGILGYGTVLVGAKEYWPLRLIKVILSIDQSVVVVYGKVSRGVFCITAIF